MVGGVYPSKDGAKLHRNHNQTEQWPLAESRIRFHIGRESAIQLPRTLIQRRGGLPRKDENPIQR